LSRPILVRLRERVAHESDELVWRNLLAAVGNDATEDCAELAGIALAQRQAEVRQLGCEYFARHGRPSDAVRLLDLLQDPGRNVRLAAVQALGACGNPIAIRGRGDGQAAKSPPNLLALLASADPALQFAAAVSLCRLGAPEGMQELMRLSCHTAPKVREQAAREMGLSGQTRFVGPLVTSGWTERHDAVRRAILDALEKLVPVENRPASLGVAATPDAKIKCWAEWWQARSGSPVQDVPRGAPLTTNARGEAEDRSGPETTSPGLATHVQPQ
jgi:HEAT repeat protein